MSQPTDEVGSLIQLIDEEYRDRNNVLLIAKLLLFIGLFVAFGLVVIGGLPLVLLPFLAASENIPQTLITIFLTAFTLTISFGIGFGTAEFFKVGPREVIEWNYQRMLKKRREANKVLLYALIAVKNRHPKLKLRDVAESNGELFELTRLTGRLYSEEKPR